MENSSKTCRCNISKVDRVTQKDKVVKRDDAGKILLEHLGFKCRRCGRGWIQIIDYGKSGRKVIKWRKA